MSEALRRHDRWCLKTPPGLLTAAGCALAALIAAPAAASAEDVLVQAGSPMQYLANSADPGIGVGWTAAGFSTAGWGSGVYGVGYETSSGAQNLIATPVPVGSSSVYTRASFTIPQGMVIANLFIGADYDDGFIAWINGVEVYRSPQMPAGAPAWNTSPASHESTNGATPGYEPLQDITAAGFPALIVGENVLAVGVWNVNDTSSDLVVAPLLVANLSPQVTRGPYLQKGSPTGIVVRWRTGADTDSVVRYGLSPSKLSVSAGDARLTSEHEVEITGLAPDTVYYYSVGASSGPLAGGDADHFFRTSPLPGLQRPLRIWAIGDSGTGSSSARAVRDAYLSVAGSGRTDLWLMLGDNAYPDGADSAYQTAVFDMYPQLLQNSVLWPTLGNHDGMTANSSSQSGPYYDIFTLPKAGESGGLPSGTEAYYSFDHGDIHFICLESNETDRSPGGAMLTWLKQDLAATDQRWIIAFWHHPPYTKGSHNSDTESQLVEMRQNALPILEDAGVDLVLSGHSHSYERSFLIDGHYGTSSTFSVKMLKDGGDGREDGNGAYQKPGPGPVSHAGAVYVVAGSSGKISGGTLDHPAMFASLNVLGSVILDVDANRLDGSFLDSTGAIRDYFTLIKGEAAIIKPFPPSDLGAAAVATDQIDLSWTDGSSDEEGFRIERSLDGKIWSGIAVLGADTTLLSDTGLAPGTQYFYRVIAFNTAGDSSPSNVAGEATPGGESALGFVIGEERVVGKRKGKFSRTLEGDGKCQKLREKRGGSKQTGRFSLLEHRWLVEVPSGSSPVLFVRAHRTPPADADEFMLSYSLDGSTFVDMLAIDATEDDGSYLSFPLPPAAAGSVIIRLIDTDRTPGEDSVDSVYVDHLFIRTE